MIDAQRNVENTASFVEDFDVRLNNGVALLSNCTRMTGRYRGKPFACHNRHFDNYVCRSGERTFFSL